MAQLNFRTMEFKFAKDGFPKYWHSQSPSISLFYNALSAAFPPGERFFCESLKFFQEDVAASPLSDDIDVFVKQEMHHMFHHRKFNEVAIRQGFDLKEAEARNKRFLDHARKKYSPLEHLALTAAFEHLTAVIADHVLSTGEFVRDAQEEAAALWLWHAAEETEHKSVAIDLYQAVGGGYWTRVKVYLLAFYQLFAIAFSNQWQMLKQDGTLSVRQYLRFARYLMGKQGLFWAVMGSLLVYFHPRFHPQQHENSHLVREWERDHKEQIRSKAS